MSKDKSKKRRRRNENVDIEANLEPKKTEALWMPILKHLGAYIILLLAVMLYLKPAAFDGKSLQQHDNVQAMYQQAEINDYKEETGKTIRWTNHMFGGMPTAIIRNNNINHIPTYFSRIVSVATSKTEIRTLFLIMLFAYIGLILLNVNYVLSLGLAIILGFITSNLLFIAAGHTGKMDVLAIVPFVVGAFIYAYKRNLLVGSLLFVLAMSYGILRNHYQITYYTYFALSIIGGGFLIESIKKNELPKFGKFAIAMVAASLLAVLTNLGSLWPVYEYGQASTRGKSELTKKETVTTSEDAKKDAGTGLGYDYVFGLSFEKAEIGTLMFPNFYGGTQGKSFYSDPTSMTYNTFSNPNVQQEIVAAAKRSGIKDSQQINQFMNQLINQYTRQYRGSQSMCGGPVYYGVVVCVLLFLALMLIRGTMKWAIISVLSFFVVLAWGRHFAVFNDLMYYYFPMYSKFRDTKMTLLVAQPIIILAIGLGLMNLVKFKAEDYADTWTAKLLPKINQSVSKEGYVLMAGLIGVGISLLTYVYLSVGTISGPQDASLMAISPKLVAALEADRAALAKSDIFKAIGFILATTATLYFYARKVLTIEIMAVVITLLAVTDLALVNSEYVNKDSYKTDYYKDTNKNHVPQKSDAIILKDKSIYKVVDYSRGAPSQTAATSGFHKSLGGYFAAKPLLYQELWNYYQLDNPNVALQQHSNLMNMLNAKYIIINSERTMDNPTALGNAWFVENIQEVANADEEISALDELKPTLDAIVQTKYAGYVKGLNSDYQAGDKIYLKHYHPDTMIYEAQATKDRFAVFSEMYYPFGWNVYIDGEKVDPFIKTNYVLRGLKVPAGKHEIKMIYEPQSVLLGGRINLLANLIMLLLTGVAGYQFYKRNKEE